MSLTPVADRPVLLGVECAAYHVDAHASIQGNEISMKNSVTSGWAKRANKWLNVFAVASAR